MSGRIITGGLPLAAVLQPLEGMQSEIPAVVVSLSEGPAATAVWRLRLEVQTETGRKVLGTVQTIPPASGAPPARVVAVAGCPGALTWHVISELVSGHGGAGPGGAGNLPARAQLDINASPCCGELGIRPVHARDVSAGAVGAGFGYDSGNAPAIVAVPAGVSVRQILVDAGAGAVATLDIAGGDTKTIQPSDTFALVYEAGDLVGPLNVNIGGDVESYWVDWR